MASLLTGFRCLEIRFDASTKKGHILYCKPHNVRQGETRFPQKKTLFVVNVPPYCTEEGIKNAFYSYGNIKDACVCNQPNLQKDTDTSQLLFPKKMGVGFQYAYVVFAKSSAVRKVMDDVPSGVLYISNDERSVKAGIEKWCNEYKLNYPNPTALQKQIDTFMAKFDDADSAKTNGDNTDDDGWVTVTRGGKNPALPAGKVSKKEKKKKKEKELLYFYQFQQREARRDNIADMRRKFEEDKKRITVMKEQRKFKPY